MKRTFLSAAIAMVLPVVALAQVGLPDLRALPLPTAPLGGLLESIETLGPRKLGRVLERARLDRLSDFIRKNPREVMADDQRLPAVRGVLLVTGADEAALGPLGSQGFAVIERVVIKDLDLSYARVAIPDGVRPGTAAEQLRRLLPGADVAFDSYYLPTGVASATAGASSGASSQARVGVIDGGLPTGMGASQRSFASPAPVVSAHTAGIASLIAGKAPQRSAAPGAGLVVADVYGTGPGGGSASSIARALGWMAEQKVPVVVLSLVGPDNSLLRAAVRGAQGRGTIIVAAVGNDGPASPPSYPASLPGVLAVTGTDIRGRLLPEVGNALHVDFAAPASGIKALDARGRMVAVRGTSFAAPLVAGRLARHYPRADLAAIRPAVLALIAEARDLGLKGRDTRFGHGLICGDCGAR